eukprot:6484072-Amphidinium_carterae.1
MTTPTTEGECDDDVSGAPDTVPHLDPEDSRPGYNTDDTHNGTGSSLTIDATIIDDMMKIMWSSLVSPQCAPTVHTLLHKSWLALPLEDPRREQSTILAREIVIDMTTPIQRN